MGAYDEPRYHEQRTIVVTGQALAGTSAARNLVRVRCPKAVTLKAATWCAITGGTAAAAATVTINKSLGGTGALSACATKAFTTDADAASGAFTVTETDFAAGDHLVISMAGTTAVEHVLDMALDFVEDFS